MRCLTEAEEKSKDICELHDLIWALIAYSKAWKEILNDRTEARRCLINAMAVVEELKNNSWWPLLECAEAWMSILNDETEARECIMQAELTSTSVLEWSWCATRWNFTLKDEQEAQRCMRQAEKKSKTKSDWKFCADSWSSLGNEEEAKRCRKKIS